MRMGRRSRKERRRKRKRKGTVSEEEEELYIFKLVVLAGHHVASRILCQSTTDHKDKTHILEVQANILPPDTSPRQICNLVAQDMREVVLEKGASIGVTIKNAEWLDEVRKKAKDMRAIFVNSASEAYKETLRQPP